MGKLVRDNIIEIMRSQGKAPEFHIAADDEYGKALLEKLNEEVQEYRESEKPEELADIIEVIQAISAHKNISLEELEAMRQDKATRNGQFTKKIILDS